jgi:hypothetical protein
VEAAEEKRLRISPRPDSSAAAAAERAPGEGGRDGGSRQQPPPRAGVFGAQASWHHTNYFPITDDPLEPTAAEEGEDADDNEGNTEEWRTLSSASD